MVAKIKCGKNMRGALAYNESKVSKGEAELIYANKFGMSKDQLSTDQKLQRFNSLFQLNPRVRTNTVHISLNFDPSERFTDGKLAEISQAYMDKLGFGHQPFLVYRHDDAAHPHIHIVTTNIQRDGRPINLHNIGRIRSETARKAVEKQFNLVVAEGRSKTKSQPLSPLSPAKYGKTETKSGITRIVQGVIAGYKFTSINELNAVLNQFNVAVDRGYENTEMFRKQGLVYSLLKNGKRVGVPIKASSINTQATYQFLVEHFKVNKIVRKSFESNTRDRVFNAMHKSNRSLSQFETLLKKEEIVAAWAKNKNGQTFGVTFVDHKNKVVFKGSDLGNELSAKNILERLSSTSILNQSPESKLPASTWPEPYSIATKDIVEKSVIESLLAPIDNPAGTSPILRKPRRKRRNKKVI